MANLERISRASLIAATMALTLSFCSWTIETLLLSQNGEEGRRTVVLLDTSSLPPSVLGTPSDQPERPFLFAVERDQPFVAEDPLELGDRLEFRRNGPTASFEPLLPSLTNPRAILRSRRDFERLEPWGGLDEGSRLRLSEPGVYRFRGDDHIWGLANGTSRSALASLDGLYTGERLTGFLPVSKLAAAASPSFRVELEHPLSITDNIEARLGVRVRADHLFLTSYGKLVVKVITTEFKVMPPEPVELALTSPFDKTLVFYLAPQKTGTWRTRVKASWSVPTTVDAASPVAPKSKVHSSLSTARSLAMPIGDVAPAPPTAAEPLEGDSEEEAEIAVNPQKVAFGLTQAQADVLSKVFGSVGVSAIIAAFVSAYIKRRGWDTPPPPSPHPPLGQSPISIEHRNRNRSKKKKLIRPASQDP